jgi:Family of unknown function (DUF6524)
MAVQGISWSGVCVRIGVAVALVLVTYNPTGYSFYHWLSAPPGGITPVKALLGVVLLIGWVVCLRTVYVALGWLGVILGMALLAALAWVFIDNRWIDVTAPTAVAWLALLVLGGILGVGLSWSLVRARLTGQIEVQ